MAAVFLSPLYLLLNAYLVFRMLQWFRTLSGFMGTLWFVVPFLAFYILLCLTPLTAVLFHGRLQILTRRISNYWLGILMYFLILLFTSDLIWLIYCLIRKQTIFQAPPAGILRIGGGIVFFCVLAISVCGICHASHIKKTFYEVTVDKPSDLSRLRIALVADLHLGCNVDNRLVKKMTAAVNSIRPDLIIFAGDTFDNDFDSIDHPEEILRTLRQMRSTYGAWACWGNHDISEKILAGFTFSSGDSTIGSDPRMDQFLKDAGIRLLEDESIQFGQSFTLTGRLDRSWAARSGLPRKTPAQLAKLIDRRLPAIVIDHQPAEFGQLSAAGFDLDLSGHTHDGQIFPSTIFTRIGWKNSYGIHQEGTFTSIVTSGAGVWGPAMRLGTHNEVAEILVNFHEAKP
ncbi:MAG: metallophosphoesterase [Lachnospiraceae bacterium]|nr:metallophosphoesterase [Lachnospiraceae bacterium]